jgi:cell division protein ZipA
MNELRVILLVAGILLIVGLYIWGMRSRARTGTNLEPRKPAVFTGSADSFESETPALDDDAVESDSTRIEPPSVEAGSSARTVSARREPTWSPGEDDAEPTARTADRVSDRAADRRIEPSFGPDADEPGFDAEPHAQEEAPPPPKRPSQKIIAMRVNAVAPARLDGGRLKDAILAEGLEFGRYDIFHRLHTDGRPVFSVASLREPGTFDPEAMTATQYPGIALFVVLPGPVAAAEAIDEMVFTARALAAQLGGALADERGVPYASAGYARTRSSSNALPARPESHAHGDTPGRTTNA